MIFYCRIGWKKGVLLSHETPFVSIEFDNIYYDDGVYQGFFEVELNGKVGLFDKMVIMWFLADMIMCN